MRPLFVRTLVGSRTGRSMWPRVDYAIRKPIRKLSRFTLRNQKMAEVSGSLNSNRLLRRSYQNSER
jgi:hypothetical protein